MKYKNILTKYNYLYVGIMSILSIGIGYLFIKESYYVTGITLLLLFTFMIISYLFISYQLDSKFIVRYGIIKISFDYKKITKVVRVKDKVKVSIGSIDFIVNTLDNELFYSEIKKKVGLK